MDVLRDFMEQLRADGIAEKYNRLVMEELADAGAIPLIARISNKTRRKKKRR